MKKKRVQSATNTVVYTVDLLDNKTQDLMEVDTFGKIPHLKIMLIALGLRPLAINAIFGLVIFPWVSHVSSQLDPISCDLTCKYT